MLQQEFGARFRAISPYVQDNWKVNSKLTLDVGIRYDFFPSVTEVHNNMSFFNPNLLNPVTGVNGALQFASAAVPHATREQLLQELRATPWARLSGCCRRQ